MAIQSTSHAAKALYIYKRPCLVRDKNPGSTAPQLASVTLYWMGVRGESRLRHILRNQRRQTLTQITTQFNNCASCTVSKRTVRRSLHRMGFRSHRRTRIPLLNAHHQTARLAWAREHRNWSVEDWKRVA
ncbi:HTH_Tnp_Tc3_2 domain-containing protein [Trichonephila clavipes]|nr:HTH_Tnp_Tc3_2 domain-containing protein [Trichonephila clavipes]